MLDDTLKAQLQAYLGKLQRPIRLIASLDDSASSQELRELLVTIAGLSEQVSFDDSGSDARKPSFVIARDGETTGVRFAAIPLGHEFTSLVLALLWTGGHPPKAEQETLDAIGSLQGEMDFEVYMSLSCHNCPDVVQALSLMAIRNPAVKVTVIDGGLFQAEVEARQVMAVPMVYLNGQEFGGGRMTLEEIVAKLDVNADAREAAKLDAKDPFDVLIVGGGPAGAAAAVYAARKGIRVGERHAGDRELHQRARDRWPEVRHRTRSAGAPLWRGHHEPSARRKAGACQRARRPGAGGDGQRRLPASAQRDPVHRCALAQRERAR
jgi:NADH-dependent peroxiredoxin subunit F